MSSGELKKTLGHIWRQAKSHRKNDLKAANLRQYSFKYECYALVDKPSLTKAGQIIN